MIKLLVVGLVVPTPILHVIVVAVTAVTVPISTGVAPTPLVTTQ
jgi:hypothetical protein